MNKCIALFLFLFVSTWCFGQKHLLFYNEHLLKTIDVKEGHKVSILYKGYNGQIEFFSHTVTNITDSTITLGAETSKTPGGFLSSNYKIIRIEHIIGFRRMTLGRQLAKTGVGVAGIVASFYLLHGVYNNSAISNTAAFFISLGTGFALFGVNQLLFPEGIKYHFKDGWQVKVLAD